MSKEECICEPDKPMHNTACECICHMGVKNERSESQFQMNENEVKEFIDNPKESGE
jgi:hypothetical protein